MSPYVERGATTVSTTTLAIMTRRSDIQIEWPMGNKIKSRCHLGMLKAKIDCISLFMCPLLAQLKIGFFSSFSAAAVYSTNETNKAGLKQSIIFRCLWLKVTNAGIAISM
jgi:hypothetical protein